MVISQMHVGKANTCWPTENLPVNYSMIKDNLK